MRKRRTGFVALLLLAAAAGLAAQESTSELAQILSRVTRNLQATRRILVAIHSTGDDFMMSPLEGESQFLRVRDPQRMRALAHAYEIAYEDAWDRAPEKFYQQLVKRLEDRVGELRGELEARRHAERLSFPQDGGLSGDGPVTVPRDAQGRPVVTDALISRYLKALYSATQTGSAPWRGGNFTKFDYDDVSKRIEWARRVKLSQGGPTIVSTPAMREQFSDEEVAVLNRRWRDLDNAQNGRWNEVNW